jgi:hypothetical protein
MAVNRRSFLGRIGKAVAGAVIAAHMDLGSLVPLPTALPFSRTPAIREYYSIEWPIITRQWTFGTEVLNEHESPRPWQS